MTDYDFIDSDLPEANREETTAEEEYQTLMNGGSDEANQTDDSEKGRWNRLYGAIKRLRSWRQ